jgi:hypothetical protein
MRLAINCSRVTWRAHIASLVQAGYRRGGWSVAMQPDGESMYDARSSKSHCSAYYRKSLLGCTDHLRLEGVLACLMGAGQM